MGYLILYLCRSPLLLSRSLAPSAPSLSRSRPLSIALSDSDSEIPSRPLYETLNPKASHRKPQQHRPRWEPRPRQCLQANRVFFLGFWVLHWVSGRVACRNSAVSVSPLALSSLPDFGFQGLRDLWRLLRCRWRLQFCCCCVGDFRAPKPKTLSARP